MQLASNAVLLATESFCSSTPVEEGSLGEALSFLFQAFVLAFLVAIVIMAEVPGSSVEKSAGLEELITVVTSLKEQVQRQQEAQVSLTQQLAVLQQQQTTSVPGSRGCGDNGSFPPTQPTGRLRYRIMWFRCFELFCVTIWFLPIVGMHGWRPMQPTHFRC